MQKHIQHNKDKWTQFFRKIYLSLFLKGSKVLRKVLSVRGELETEHNCKILTPPQLFWLQQHFFSVLLGCSTGDLGAPPLRGHGSHSNIFFPTDLNILSQGLYNKSHSIQPLDSQSYPLIPWYLRPDAPVIYTGAFLLLTAWPGSICYSINGNEEVIDIPQTVKL